MAGESLTERNGVSDFIIISSCHYLSMSSCDLIGVPPSSAHTAASGQDKHHGSGPMKPLGVTPTGLCTSYIDPVCKVIAVSNLQPCRLVSI